MYRRKLRQNKAKAGVVQTTDSGAEVDADADDHLAEDDEDSENENASGREDRHIVKGRKSSSPEESAPDMYKALDGSALMAIGTPFFRRFYIRNSE
jgi:hypothetical protein